MPNHSMDIVFPRAHNTVTTVPHIERDNLQRYNETESTFYFQNSKNVQQSMP